MLTIGKLALGLQIPHAIRHDLNWVSQANVTEGALQEESIIRIIFSNEDREVAIHTRA